MLMIQHFHEIDRHKTRLVYSTTQSQISTAGLDASASFVEGTSVHTGTTNVIFHW